VTVGAVSPEAASFSISSHSERTPAFAGVTAGAVSPEAASFDFVALALDRLRGRRRGREDSGARLQTPLWVAGASPRYVMAEGKWWSK
jgi:hypothetical protein